MSVKHSLSRAIGTVLKYTLNPLTLQLARSGVGPFALVEHVGRRSGKRYQTPLIVAPLREGGVVVELTYGFDVDWYKNVVAAGSGAIVRNGQRYVINQVEPMPADAGRAAFPLPARVILRLLRRTHFVRMVGPAA
jgi:deazaflavin-dependent oxidoreductase (nitroreductase family)